jgi:hypothetical protein
MGSNTIETERKPTTSVDTMRTTLVDEVSSFLLSMTVLLGLAVAMLLMIVFPATSDVREKTSEIKFGGGRTVGASSLSDGFQSELDSPNAAEVEQLLDPLPELVLQNVADRVSSMATLLVGTDRSNDGDRSDSIGGPERNTIGPVGDTREIPRFERWDLRFSAKDSGSYARQLDFFKIELGVIGGGHLLVDYLANVAGTAERRAGVGEAENRIYFVNRSEGPLAKYERIYLSRAGISTTDRQVLKLIPPALEEELANLEINFAKEKRGESVSAKELAKTVFDCQPKPGKGFQWVVIEQRYRVPKQSISAGRSRIE